MRLDFPVSIYSTARPLPSNPHSPFDNHPYVHVLFIYILLHSLWQISLVDSECISVQSKNLFALQYDSKPIIL